jgi:hypothetical protein
MVKDVNGLARLEEGYYEYEREILPIEKVSVFRMTVGGTKP